MREVDKTIAKAKADPTIMKGLIEYVNWQDRSRLLDDVELRQMAQEWWTKSDTNKDGELSLAEAKACIMQWAEEELGVKKGSVMHEKCFLTMDSKFERRNPQVITVDELCQHMKKSQENMYK